MNRFANWIWVNAGWALVAVGVAILALNIWLDHPHGVLECFGELIRPN